MTNNKNANRLQHELSPYLLQHQYNPVEWYAWGDEAFEKAKRENKPIFLSIGYSTCHWCHVMEHESFEDVEVAGILNQHFVAIKVDREERPDVDGVYMTVCQNMTGHGGWPLTIMMTHEKKPFFAGTYFPKEDKHNRPGMMSLLSRVAVLWKNQNQEILNSAEEIVGALQQYNQLSGEAEPTEELLHKAFKQFEERFDKEQGGFGNAPKFPSPHNLTFLLRYHEKYNNPASLQMVEDTLKAMRAGGIYDHIGYGFHRYSTDREWLLPHFEKMLYDQALLMIAYAEAFAITGEELYRSTISEISGYVERVFTSPEGGFYSAEDADSEGEEGKFYLWHQPEVEQLLGEKAAEYIAHYHFKKDGNFFDPFKGDYTGENIPHLKTREYQATQQYKKENQILFDEREKRVHPHKDDKVLTDWNGLMIAAFAKASTLVNEEHLSKRLLGNAIKAEQFIANTMMSEGRLLHRYRSGTAGINGTLEDYAFMIWGLLELFYATAESKYLAKAVALQFKQDELFYNTEQGAYYTTAHDAEELMIRQIELYDGAIPSGNSVAINNLVTLYNITGDEQLNQKLTQSLKVLTPITGNYPSGHTQYLSGVLQHLAQGTTNIVVANTKHEAKPLIQKYIGNQLLQRPILLTEENREEIIKLAPWIKEYKQVNGKPTLYSCQNFTCEVPKN